MTATLMIGGPADGKRHRDEFRRAAINVIHGNNFELYYLQQLSAGEAAHWVYVHEAVSLDNALDLLLRSYKPE
jgi:hypothetical protein